MSKKATCSYCGAPTEESQENNLIADGGRSFCSAHCELEFEARRRGEERKEEVMVA